jgi:Ca2+-binding EF-hand superfamily protein
MKKILLSTIAVLALSAPAAMAEHGGDHKGGRMLEKLDADKDGSISKAEFMTEAEQRFAEIDKDSSGSITKEEVEAKAAEWKAKRAEMKAKKEAGEAPAEAAPEAAPAEAAPAPESAE